MRIVNVVDPTQGHAQVHHRVIPPPTSSPPPRKVQAINQHASPDDPNRVGTAPPDDGISLALSPEAREAARQAMIEELRASQTRPETDDAETSAAADDREAAEKTEQQRAVQQLEEQDRKVRSHEQAHAAAAGSLAKGTVSYTYQLGPDGHLYAVGGQLSIDTSPVPGDPQATLRKAEQIEQASFAPGDSSAADRAAAALAVSLATHARQELARQQEEQQAEAKRASGPHVSENG
ncbi:MAG TPA: putative metalloprotease CJM1_0395 family protein [Vicinamibacterales bacterium]|jgi:hypothetical protein